MLTAPLTVPPRRRPARACAYPLVLALAVAALPAAAPGPATAHPAAAAAAPIAAAQALVPAAPGDTVGSEGGSPLLRDVLAATGRGFLAARAKHDASLRRQLRLTLEMRDVEARLAALTVEVGAVAAEGYRTGRLGPLSALLRSGSPDAFLDRAAALETMAALDDRKMRELNATRKRVADAKAAIDAEVAEQRKQVAIMALKKRDAERALATAGGRATGGFVVASSPVAKPAPRAADGSFPAQSCARPDPTTSGCITARTLHALTQTKAAGFTRFVSCFRSGGPFEHPKGRACDFSAERNGFGGDATGGDRLYGNNLAAFLVRNADRLGVLYVIWYRQIWFPATGWKSYSGTGGDPSSDHTNHIHLSMF